MTKHFQSVGWAWHPDEETIRALKRGQEKLKAAKTAKEIREEENNFRILVQSNEELRLMLPRDLKPSHMDLEILGTGYLNLNSRTFTTRDGQSSYVYRLDGTLAKKSALIRKPKLLAKKKPTGKKKVQKSSGEMVSLSLLIPPGIPGQKARRILRNAGYSSNDQGKWEFPVEQSQIIISLLKNYGR